MFKPVSPQVNFPQLEEEVLAFWKENNIFKKSIENRPKHKRWTFLDGPPFVTGTPHYGSLLSSLPKDVFGRYYTMKGYRVRRVWGWDGHGLPIENKVENQLGTKRKKDIEQKVGVKTFIEECKKWVNQISSEWEWYVDHIGRWVDFKNAYKTWDLPYMESVMWVFKQMYDKGLIYKGIRVSLYCPHCSTPISNFEVAMDAENYKDIPDVATTYKYKLEGEKDTFILAWSTTPWNKIVTPALAVNPSLTYVKVAQNGEHYILAQSTLEHVLEGEYQVVETFPGTKLVGKTFEPHYDYYRSRVKEGDKVFTVIGADFVTAEDGTGVVTIAAYGEDDLKVMKQQSVHIETHLDDEGHIKADVPLFGGMYYLKANDAVDEDLAKRGLIYKREQYTHSVPHCWRCGTRLYYAPLNAWFVNVQSLKDLLKKTNEEINWYPAHFKHGRFLKSLENAPDWCISRNRYWGSPVPVWELTHEDGEVERYVPGSIAELEEVSGKKIADLHKPDIDEVLVPSKKAPGTFLKRTPEVLDSWIEAGSASFAERHYPFGSDEKLEDFFPPDFIAEYTGQIRAWFYVLHVIGGALYQSKAFKNVLVEGVILGNDGRKMSKNFKNYPDPREMLLKYGGDALRLYLMSTPVMRGEDIRISEEDYRVQVRGMLLTLWNTYNFFITYANTDGWEPDNKPYTPTLLDNWVLALLKKTHGEVTKALDNYDTVSAIESLQFFVNELSTWYIRRSRERVGPAAENKESKEAFYKTSFHVLTTVAQLLAPLAPFISDAIYKNLTGEESVHLTDWPLSDTLTPQEEELLAHMVAIRKAIEAAHAQRKAKNLPVKQALHKAWLYIDGAVKSMPDELTALAQEELNVLHVELVDNTGKGFDAKLDETITEELITMRKVREAVREIQSQRKAMGLGMKDAITLTLPKGLEPYKSEIAKKVLATKVEIGEQVIVKKQ